MTFILTGQQGLEVLKVLSLPWKLQASGPMAISIPETGASLSVRVLQSDYLVSNQMSDI